MPSLSPYVFVTTAAWKLARRTGPDDADADGEGVVGGLGVCVWVCGRGVLVQSTL